MAMILERINKMPSICAKARLESSAQQCRLVVNLVITYVPQLQLKTTTPLLCSPRLLR